MPENSHDNRNESTDEAKSVFQIQELITVPDRDLSPAEMQKIMKQVARVCNFLASLIMRHAATGPNNIGAGHPICQNILNAAVQADTAALQLAGPPQIMQPRADIPASMQRRH